MSPLLTWVHHKQWVFDKCLPNQCDVYFSAQIDSLLHAVVTEWGAAVVASRGPEASLWTLLRLLNTSYWEEATPAACLTPPHMSDFDLTDPCMEGAYSFGFCTRGLWLTNFQKKKHIAGEFSWLSLIFFLLFYHIECEAIWMQLALRKAVTGHLGGYVIFFLPLNLTLVLAEWTLLSL